MSRSPSKPDAASLLDAASSHYVAGRLEEAARLYRRVEAGDSRNIRAVYSLAVIDLRLGRAKPALRRLRVVVAREPGLFAAQQNLGAVCETLGLWAEAAEAYQRARDLQPETPEAGFGLARTLAVLGRVDEAIGCYRLLAADPALRTRALTRLAILDAAAIGDRELADLRQGAEDPRLDHEARTAVCFALGEVLDRRGAYDDAFAAFAAGNQLKREHLIGQGADPAGIAQEHEATVQHLAARFTAAFMTHPRGAQERTRAPIFVVGMPRSGSSLIEQILASHRQVQGLGESSALSDAADGALAKGRLERADWRDMARAYLDAARSRGWSGDGRFVDKTLENHLRVGLIHLVFPNAVILHSRRDAVDTCLACYRQLFVSGAETLYDLRETGEAYVRYRRMMEHWASVLPGRVIDVDHQALVGDPEASIRWLVTEACGLDWDEACLNFHQAEGHVRTASAAQVRKPLFASSVGRWKRYERHLGPLLQALGPYASRDG